MVGVGAALEAWISAQEAAGKLAEGWLLISVLQASHR